MEEFEGLKQLNAGRSFRSLTGIPKGTPGVDEDFDNRMPASLAVAINDAADRKVATSSIICCHFVIAMLYAAGPCN